MNNVKQLESPKTINRIKNDKTDRKYQIYNVIIDYMFRYGYPPTIREICSLTGFKSTCSVAQYMTKLKEEGLINFDPLASRTITVPGIKYIDERNMGVCAKPAIVGKTPKKAKTKSQNPSKNQKTKKPDTPKTKK